MSPVSTANAPAAIGPYSPAVDSGAGLVFLADMGDFAAMNEVYAQFFNEPFPARSAVAVKTLPKNALVEIECIAAK